MNQDQFVARRQEQWKQLAQILAQAQRMGPRKLPLDQVQQMGRLYRQTASDLAYARTYFPNSQATLYLNQLVAQAHSLIYAEEPQRLKSLWRFFAQEVPRTVRGAWRPLVLSIALMLLGGLVGFFAILHDPNLAEALVPDAMRNVTPRAGGADWPVEWRSLIGTLIMINNIRVTILAFGLGFTLGIGTGVLLFYNGLVVGALAAHYHAAGLAYSFWALIVPHGMLELMAIFLGGAAGFCMGWPLVAPGDQTRLQALAAGARRAVILMLGALPFLVIAAAIEGFVTPLEGLSEAGKYGVAGVTLLLGLAYWLLPGRRRAPEGQLEGGPHPAPDGVPTASPAP
ncbi:MAG: stage II sporulation protein M [Bacillota bacterium]